MGCSGAVARPGLGGTSSELITPPGPHTLSLVGSQGAGHQNGLDTLTWVDTCSYPTQEELTAQGPQCEPGCWPSLSVPAMAPEGPWWQQASNPGHLCRQPLCPKAPYHTSLSAAGSPPRTSEMVAHETDGPFPSRAPAPVGRGASRSPRSVSGCAEGGFNVICLNGTALLIHPPWDMGKARKEDIFQDCRGCDLKSSSRDTLRGGAYTVFWLPSSKWFPVARRQTRSRFPAPCGHDPPK